MDACLQDAFCVYSHVATIIIGSLAFWVLSRPAAPIPTIDYSLARDSRRFPKPAAETPAPVRTKVYTRALALLEEEMGDWYINRMVELELAALFRKKGRVEENDAEDDDDEIIDEEDADNDIDEDDVGDEGDIDEDDADDEGEDETDDEENEDDTDDENEDIDADARSSWLRKAVIAQLNAAVETAKREAIVDFATHADPAMSPEDRAAAIQRACEDASRAATAKFLSKED